MPLAALVLTLWTTASGGLHEDGLMDCADAAFAPAYRGLGEVYEQQKRPRDAAEAYLNYIKQAPTAPDRPIVMGRLRLLTTLLKVEQ